MSMITRSVGLDYHDNSIQVCVMDGQGKILHNRSYPNDVEAVLDAILKHGERPSCAIEACCGAADFAEELRLKTNWNVRLGHPTYVSRLKKSTDKHDAGDAGTLADLVRVGYLPEVWLAPESTRELRHLVRYRHQLKRNVVEIKQQMRALLRDVRVRSPYNSWTKAWRAWLLSSSELSEMTKWVLRDQLSRLEQVEARKKKVEEHLETLMRDDKLVQTLLKMPGIGNISAVTIRAQIGTFRRFKSGKQLARYCGVTPRNVSSGSREADAGITKAGNSELRTMLIEAAHCLARHDPRWRAMSDRMRKTKPYSVVMAAIANRWIRGLYYQMVAIETGEKTPAELSAEQGLNQANAQGGPQLPGSSGTRGRNPACPTSPFASSPLDPGSCGGVLIECEGDVPSEEEDREPMPTAAREIKHEKNKKRTIAKRGTIQ